MSNLTPRQVVDLLPTLLRRVPAKIRDWVYLGLVVAAVAFIVVTAVRDGFTAEQLLALLVAGVGALAKANRTDQP